MNANGAVHSFRTGRARLNEGWKMRLTRLSDAGLSLSDRDFRLIERPLS
jgi:hypothetical protein